MNLAKTLLATIELRAGSVITPNEIAALKKRWSPHARVGQDDVVHASDEYSLLMEHGPYQISDEQALKGIDWWQARCFNKKGMRRNTQFTRANLDSDHMWDVLDNCARFELVDWEWQSNGYGLEWPFPVYRMIASDGKWFDYVSMSWQSGGHADRRIINDVGGV